VSERRGGDYGCHDQRVQILLHWDFDRNCQQPGRAADVPRGPTVGWRCARNTCDLSALARICALERSHRSMRAREGKATARTMIPSRCSLCILVTAQGWPGVLARLPFTVRSYSPAS
jgi:hypothetical protein